jgi:hypothetical protein
MQLRAEKASENRMSRGLVLFTTISMIVIVIAICHSFNEELPQAALQSSIPTQSLIILTMCTVDYKVSAGKLAQYLAFYGYTLRILPVGWTPSLGDQALTFLQRPKSLSSITYKGRGNALYFKIACISEMLDQQPLLSSFLWIDADTIILGDVGKILQRHHMNNCDMSLTTRSSDEIGDKNVLSLAQLDQCK